MNKSMLNGVVLGVMLASAGGAVAGLSATKRGPSHADVVNVRPIRQTEKLPREICEDVTVTKQKPVKDEKRIAGTAVGAVVGGLIGNQFGSGDGKALATVAGAAGGGYAGNRVQKHMQKKNTYQTTERRCETVYDTKSRTIGYQVRYRLNGKEGTVRMDHDPGKKIPVRDGQLVLLRKSAGSAPSV
jgi:uncharacterized protein YcfJ